MFIDHVVIEVIAGSGGDGCVSFRREKYVPRGGPDGGNGGRGGDVVVRASRRLSTLVDLHYRQVYKAKRGAHGRGKSQRGRDGEPATVDVPVGTQVRDVETGEIIADLTDDGAQFVVAKGGRGGLGNERFKSPRNQAPRESTPGAVGEKRRVEITLKLIADVGLVGEPNAGKSTLLSVLSAAHPKVAAYPFTTKTPVLGIVKAGDFDSFVVVDIPGLIEGAHRGKGMGKEFLRHVERCGVLLYLVDASLENPEASYVTLRNELLHYDPQLLERPSLVALTKCDLLEDGVDGVSPELLKVHAKVYPISAVARSGLDALVGALKRELDKR